MIRCECGSVDIVVTALAEFEMDEQGNAAAYIDVTGDPQEYRCRQCGKYSYDGGEEWAA